MVNGLPQFLQEEENAMEELLKEQLKEYIAKLKIVEAELVKKFKNSEDYSKELEEANGLKLLISETARMIKQYQ